MAKFDSAKPFDMMTNAELKSARPLSKMSYDVWYAEMVRRGLLRKQIETEYDKILRTSQACKMMGISRPTLIKKIKSGEIKAIKFPFANKYEWRIKLQVIKDYLQKLENNEFYG